jgi:hypothetical protein
VRLWIALLVAALVTSMAAAPAAADAIDVEAGALAGAPGYKRRLAAALALSKSHDGRAVSALATALLKDGEVQIRRVAALALPKAMDASTPVDDRHVAFAALENAASRDNDPKVRDLAARALTKLESLRPPPPSTDMPAVFVHIGDATDLSSKAPRDAIPKLTKTVKGVVTRRAGDMSTTWPGKLPTSRQLQQSGSRAFIVAATISAIDINKAANKAEIACTVSVRVAPWNGTDGAEKWVAHKAASASGSGKALTGTGAEQINGGIRDCVMAVAEEVTTKQVVPFLKRVAGDG